MKGRGGLEGWSWIFVSDGLETFPWALITSYQIIEGLMTVAVGILAFFGNTSPLESSAFSDFLHQSSSTFQLKPSF